MTHRLTENNKKTYSQLRRVSSARGDQKKKKQPKVFQTEPLRRRTYTMYVVCKHCMLYNRRCRFDVLHTARQPTREFEFDSNAKSRIQRFERFSGILCDETIF